MRPAGGCHSLIFAHSFSDTLNAHMHLHLCIPNGVFAQGRQGLVFRGAQMDEACAQRVEAKVRNKP